ncbi:MAG: DNA internalization-related competence protein ComEC/Rec2 [Gemmatimonadota bacterium]
MRPLPPLVHAALGLAAGLLVGLRASLPIGPLSCIALATLVAVFLLRTRAAAAAALAFASVGAALGQSAALEARGDCRTRVPDGARVDASGTLEARPVPGRTARFRLEGARIDGRRLSCGGTIRLAGWGRDGPAAPDPGVDVMVSGVWWLGRPAGAWPRPPEWAGMLLVDSVRAIGSADDHAHPLLSIRGAVQRRLRSLFPARSGMAEALILAERDGIDDRVRERFVRAGLVHVLAISGMHVGLIAGALLLLAKVLRLSPRAATVGAVASVIGYVAFLGAPAAASRAALQIALLSAARLMQRSADAFAAMAAAAIALLLADPMAVLSAGFQLSFLGAGGIIALRRPLHRLMPPVGPRAVRDGLAASLAALAATAPVAALHFGRVAPIGAVATLIAVPLVALAVPATALALLVSTGSIAAGGVLAGGAELAFGGLDAVAAAAATAPGAGAYVTRDAAIGWLVAAALAFFLHRRTRRIRRRVARWTVAGAVAALCIVWPVLARGLDGDALEIHAIDVGQGDAIALRSPTGRWMLVDAGMRTDGYDAGRARVVPYLLRHSVHRLDALVLTHPDADHIGGAEAVMEAFDVGAVIDPGRATGTALYLATLDAVRDAGASWVAARAGREIQWDGVRLRILHPDSAAVDEAESENNVSIVLRITYGRFAALLTGDAHAPVERELVRRHGDSLRADLLKVGHHGSETSTTEALMRTVAPTLALVSVGRRNRYGHPDPAVVRRLERHGARVLRTDRMGSITVRAWPDGRVETTTELADVVH